MRTLALAGLLLGSTLAFSAAHAQTAGQDMKNAGHDTANASKDTAHATSHATKTGYHKTVHGTKDLGDKIAGKPTPPRS
jgi:Spy/CpxP family protein refolding chaperone